jgi:hypothetical protein
MRKSPFNRHIQDLAQRIREAMLSEADPSLSQKQQATEVEDSDEVEIIEAPQKRVKSEDNQLTAYNHSPNALSPPAQGSSVLTWLVQTAIPSPREISALYGHQLALSQFIGMLPSPFPVIAPSALLHLQMGSFIAVQTFSLPVYTLQCPSRAALQ